MEFSKLQGLGNDFIILDNRDNKINKENYSKVANRICTRKLSIGADGLMIIEKSKVADFKMCFFNSDGTLAEMCGNGARCIVRYAYIKKIAKKTMSVETTSGIVFGEIIDKRNVKIKLNNPIDVRLNIDWKYKGRKQKISYLELGSPGVPHAICPLEFLKEEDFNGAKALRNESFFERGANVNLYKKEDKNTLRVKTYERGVEDFTLACGTGAASTATLAVLNNIVEGPVVNILMPGGNLKVELEIINNQVLAVFLIGDTMWIADGEIKDLDFNRIIESK